MKTNEIMNAVAFVGYLNELAAMSGNGFFPFSQCNPENQDEWSQGIVYIDKPQSGVPTHIEPNDIAADILIDENHHDVISSWDSIFSDLCDSPCEVTIGGLEYNDPHICVSAEDSDILIVVENGTWHLA